MRCRSSSGWIPTRSKRHTSIRDYQCDMLQQWLLSAVLHGKLTSTNATSLVWSIVKCRADLQPKENVESRDVGSRSSAYSSINGGGARLSNVDREDQPSC
jgi:hypothetical protein